MTIDVAPAVPVPEVQNISGEARLLHDGWVSEFEAFQWAAEARNASGTFPAVLPSARSERSERSAAVSRRSTGGGRGSGSGSGDSSKAMDDLRAEIKLLHWHKLANEAALKAALLKTKKVKMQGGANARPVPATTTLAMPIEEKAAWMQQIIEEEQSKPLQVTKDFVSKYEAQEKENEGRLNSEVAGHIRRLRNLRKQIEKREAMKDRRAKYRAAQKQLQAQKERLLGKLQSRDKESTPAQSGRPLMHDQPGIGEGTPVGAAGGQGKGSQQTLGALGMVLGSLDKLVELETRITSLEKSNVYDNFRATKPRGAETSTDRHVSRSGRSRRRCPVPGLVTSGASASSRIPRGGGAGGRARRNRLSFSKQMTEATVEAPSQVYYAVRVSNHRAGSTSVDSTSRRGRPVGRGRTGGAFRPWAGVATTRGAASTFLTQLPDVHRRAQATGGRAVWGASGGRGGVAAGFRSAVADQKHLEANRRIAGARAEALRIARQDRIIREWMQRKKAAAATANRQRRSSVLSRGTGSFTVAGRRTARAVAGSAGGATGSQANTHLQEFCDIRAEYAKRTERLRRDMSHRRRGSESTAFMAGTRTPSIARRRARVSATAIASAIPVRPARMSRVGPGVGRGREPWAASVAGAFLRRGIASATESRQLAQRDREGRGLTVGGTGVRAVRAQLQQGSSGDAAGAKGSGGGGGGTCDISGSRRRDGPPWLQRARGARTLVAGVGRIIVGDGVSGGSTGGRGCW